MNEIRTNETVNIQLVESLVQAIRSLSPPEQALLEEKLFGDIPYPSTLELMHLADKGGAFKHRTTGFVQSDSNSNCYPKSPPNC